MQGTVFQSHIFGGWTPQNIHTAKVDKYGLKATKENQSSPDSQSDLGRIRFCQSHDLRKRDSSFQPC